ncbi:MAG TPA: aldolase/citrate lyase family protein, partial [Rudaea sp.]|nr:aldolase/citrate lyase family protein [Rudaea sp.]
MATANKTSTAASAGRIGPDVRSDCKVSFEPRASGGLEIELQSKVAAYYGASIREQAAEVLGHLGVEHSRLLIEDAGALPFVLAARIEAAVRRAGCAFGRQALPARVPLPPPSPRDRLRRSRLYLPGSEPKYFVNAALYHPDAIILDLEDSVHHAEKDAARILVRNALAAVDFVAAGVPADGGPWARCERMVRINQLPLGLEDLDEIVPEQPDVILIPKVENEQQVKAVDLRIKEIQERLRRERPIWLMPILESAIGIEHALEIANASPRVCALTIGLEDYTADLGVAKTTGGAE